MEKLLAIISLGQKAYGKRLIQQNLSGIISIAALIIITSIMIAASILVGFYAAYLVLLSYEILPQTAMIIVCISLVITTLVLILLVMRYLKKLGKSSPISFEQPPIATYAMSVVDSFMEGLRDRKF